MNFWQKILILCSIFLMVSMQFIPESTCQESFSWASIFAFIFLILDLLVLGIIIGLALAKTKYYNNSSESI